MNPFRERMRRYLPELATRVEKLSALSETDIQQMFHLMQSYYAGVRHDAFLQDLRAKDCVIVMRQRLSGTVVGFSTLKYLALSSQVERAVGVFSGDTIVHEDYWGRTELQRTFLLHLCRLKLQHRRARLYWFLISKGYKTYLLMANNFQVYYPRYEEKTPPYYAHLLRTVYTELYPTAYQPTQGVIVNSQSSYRLKAGIAAPDHQLMTENPRVKFFLEKNPAWQQGEELACIALMEFPVLGQYLLKTLKKYSRRVYLTKKRQASLSAASTVKI